MLLGSAGASSSRAGDSRPAEGGARGGWFENLNQSCSPPDADRKDGDAENPERARKRARAHPTSPSFQPTPAKSENENPPVSS